MACRIADNPALERLRTDIGAERLCHSQRLDCIHRLPRASENGYLGIAGAFMGYCQALFSLGHPYSENTNRIISMLETEKLPWARSHELFYGHKGSASTEDFVRDAAAPLRSSGRVPILITGLDPATDSSAIRDIMKTEANVVSGETILVRVVVSGDDSFIGLEVLMRNLIDMAFETGRMPRWWPLVQSGGTVRQWANFRRRLGKYWSYVNIAMNPFALHDLWDALADQIMVAQFIVPGERDIDDDGNVRLTERMVISGASADSNYNIRELVLRAGTLPSWPTSIFLGPTLAGWTERENLRRVSSVVRVFIDELEKQWHDKDHRYSELLRMAA